MNFLSVLKLNTKTKVCTISMQNTKHNNRTAIPAATDDLGPAGGERMSSESMIENEIDHLEMEVQTIASDPILDLSIGKDIK